MRCRIMAETFLKHAELCFAGPHEEATCWRLFITAVAGSFVALLIFRLFTDLRSAPVVVLCWGIGMLFALGVNYRHNASKPIEDETNDATR